MQRAQIVQRLPARLAKRVTTLWMANASNALNLITPTQRVSHVRGTANALKLNVKPGFTRAGGGHGSQDLRRARKIIIALRGPADRGKTCVSPYPQGSLCVIAPRGFLADFLTQIDHALSSTLALIPRTPAVRWTVVGPLSACPSREETSNANAPTVRTLL